MSLGRFLRSSRSLLAVAFVLTFMSAGFTAFAATPAQNVTPAAPRIVDRIDESKLVTLTGNTRPEARAEYDRGEVAPNLAMGDLVLVLRRSPEQQAAFDSFLAAQQDSSSPDYHHWLTPDEIGQQFGPAQADVNTISHWLQSHGFTVNSVSRDRMSIRFSGTATQVESSFHTEIHKLQVRGENHIANMSDPSIPEAFAPVVVGIKALHNFFPRPLHKLGSTVQKNSKGSGWVRLSDPAKVPSKAVAAQTGAKQVKPLFGTGAGSTGTATVEDVAPYDFATIYNVLPLWTSSTPINGTGQTIAIAGTSNIDLTDVTTFRSAFGLPPYTASNAPVVIITNSDPGDCSNYATSCQDALTENSLDVEWSGAIAPGAQIALVTSSAPTSSTDPLYLSEQYIVDNVTARIMNVSYGECELGLGTAGNAEYNTLWSTAQAAGIAVFVSTGDSGSASCDDGGDDGGTNVPYGAKFGLSVSGIASTPYDTAVGGTDFDWSWVTNGQTTYWDTSNNSTTNANALGYIPEFPWNSTCSNPELVALFNSELKESLTAGEMCNDIGDGAITSSGGSLLGLVDTIGGSGGASNCIDGNQSTVSSCTQGYPKPSFQTTGVTGIPSTDARYIPDVSFFAANGFSGTAYVICVSAAGSCSYTFDTEPTAQEVGGTSVASPIMAAVAALVNQKVGVPQGNLNSPLYKLGASESYSGCSSDSVPLTGSSCVFYDINTGTNAMPCDVSSPNCSTGSETDFNVLTGYAATTGYDPASGLGSINVSNLVDTFSTAASPLITPSPTLLLFGSTVEGTTDSTTQTVTLTNSGMDSLTISGITISGTNASSFSETNTCGSGLAKDASCTATVTFAPTAVGALAATLKIADDATGTPQTVSLNGTGTAATPAVSFSPTSLTFSSTAVGTTDSTTQSITLTNSGTASLSITGISITGTNASSFSETNTCSTTTALAAAGTCTITVTFAPTTAGSLSASISVADNASGSPQTVGFTGTGTGTSSAPAVSLSPSSLTFASTAVGSSAATQTVTVTNSGTAALTFTGVSITGTNASSFTEVSTCSTTNPLAASSTCTVTVTFTPTADGSLTASVSIADNGSNSPQTVSLTGTGSEPSGASYTLTGAAVSIAPGSSGTSAITAAGTGGYIGPMSITLSNCTLTSQPSGATDLPTCSITGATVTFASGASSGSGGTVSISTSGTTSSLKIPQLNKRSDTLKWIGTGGVALAGLLFFGIPARRRNWKALLGLFLLAAAFGVVSGCGGSSNSGSSGTTAGSYTFTVTGTDTNSNKTTATITVTVS